MVLKIDKKEFERIANEYAKRPVAKIFPENIDKIRNGICVSCGNEINEFKNPIIKKEYELSGICLDCQNKVFKDEDRE